MSQPSRESSAETAHGRVAPITGALMTREHARSLLGALCLALAAGACASDVVPDADETGIVEKAGDNRVLLDGEVSLAVDDSFVDSRRAERNHGRDEAVRVDAFPRVRWGLIKPQNLDGIAAGSRLEYALLVVHVTDDGDDVKVTELAADWAEARVTFENAPRAARSIGRFPGQRGEQIIEVTDAVQRWVDGGAMNGLGLEPTGNGGVDIASAEHRDPSLRPYFVVRVADAAAPGDGGDDADEPDDDDRSCSGRCSPDCPCEEGEGDCDRDADCAGDLVCPPDRSGAEQCVRPGDDADDDGEDRGSVGSGNLRVFVGGRWVAVGCETGEPRANGSSDQWRIDSRRLRNQDGVYLFCDEGWADGRDCECARNNREAYHAITEEDFDETNDSREHGNALNDRLAARGPMYIFPNSGHQFCLSAGRGGIIENVDGGDDRNHRESTHAEHCTRWCMGDGCPDGAAEADDEPGRDAAPEPDVDRDRPADPGALTTAFDGAILVPERRAFELMLFRGGTSSAQRDWNRSANLLWSMPLKNARGVPRDEMADYNARWRGDNSINDAKRVIRNGEIHIAVTGNGGDVVALYEFATKRCVYWSGTDATGPHDVDYIPRGSGYLVIANSQGSGSELELYDPSGGNDRGRIDGSAIAHSGVHSVHWDAEQEVLWAWGSGREPLKSYRLVFRDDGRPRLQLEDAFRVTANDFEVGTGHGGAPMLVDGQRSLILAGRDGILRFDTEDHTWEVLRRARDSGTFRNPKGLSYNPDTGEVIIAKSTGTVYSMDDGVGRRELDDAEIYKARWWFPNPFSHR